MQTLGKGGTMVCGVGHQVGKDGVGVDAPRGAPLNEALEAAEFDDMETGLLDLVGLVQANGHLAVAFDPCDRIDDDLAAAGVGLGGLLSVHHSYLQRR